MNKADFPSLQNSNKALEINLAKVYGNRTIGFLYQNAYTDGQFDNKSSVLKLHAFELVYANAIDQSKKLNRGLVLGFGSGFGQIYLTEFTQSIHSINTIANAAILHEYAFERGFSSLLIAYNVFYQLLEHEHVIDEMGTRIYINYEDYNSVNQKINSDSNKIAFPPFSR